jgi:hypothetical protein
MLTQTEYQNLLELLKSKVPENIDVVKLIIQSIDDTILKYNLCEKLTFDYLNSFKMEFDNSHKKYTYMMTFVPRDFGYNGVCYFYGIVLTDYFDLKTQEEKFQKIVNELINFLFHLKK